ncbi:MAG: pyrroloquinoline quinone-dependent dehydrogenase [Bryobacteraceae bacterium]
MKLLILLAATLPLVADVTSEKLRSSQQDSSSWLMYGRNYSAWRYSDLAEINTRNVASLTPKWIFQTGAPGSLQSTPLVFDGMMYFTGASNAAYALDLLTGRALWRYSKPVPRGVQGCCGPVNRGFAVLGERLYKVNYEGALVALDLKTGGALWETTVADFKQGFSLTLAPLIVKNKVIVGIAGAEFGVRGHIDAYDAVTGERIWRFFTVAGPGEFGAETWGGDSWKRGGASAWVTGSYDPDLNLIYWGTGNPGPDMNGDVRPGDNLFSCSLLALDVDTGKRKWHYQFTPHDVHDWDATEDLPLVDVTIGGKKIKAVIQANRNGFFYTLDRDTGKLLVAKPYTKVSWASRIGQDGRPVLVPGQDPKVDGNKACPGLGGGHNWQPTSYSPQTGLYYFGSTDGCQTYFKTDADYIEGQWYQLSTTEGIPHEPSAGSVIAVDPATGDARWRLELLHSPSGGMLSTGGGLVFTGDGFGYLIALDARTGKPLWRFQTGGSIVSGPITYSFQGKQYVAVAASTAIITFALPAR